MCNHAMALGSGYKQTQDVFFMLYSLLQTIALHFDQEPEISRNFCLGNYLVHSCFHDFIFLPEVLQATRTCFGIYTVYPKKYAHGYCFAVLCSGYTLTDFPISIRLTSLALWQSNDCPSASNATLMNMDKYFM